MINFLFKKKNIVLDCFTFYDVVKERFPISESKNHLPEWFKNAPKPKDHNKMVPTHHMTSIRKCGGLIDLFKRGAVLPLPCDVKIRSWYKDGVYNVDSFNVLSDLMVLTSFSETFHHLTNPWVIKQNNNIPFLITNCHYHSKRPSITISNGVIHFKYNPQLHIFFHMFKQEGGTEENPNIILLEGGFPILHMIPLEEVNVKVNTHLVSQTDFFNMGRSSCFFLSNYAKLQKY